MAEQVHRWLKHIQSGGGGGGWLAKYNGEINMVTVSVC